MCVEEPTATVSRVEFVCIANCILTNGLSALTFQFLTGHKGETTGEAEVCSSAFEYHSA